ncbi:MAG: HK97 gp10 family phage protein [Nanoarchaeota archaeon]|nr:HK97 gp10 family phage protein [Nanoarchaeota archaeon]
MTGLNESKEKVIKDQKKVLWLAMHKMWALMLNRVPVDTGHLKSSIHIDPKSQGFNTYTIATGVKYAVDIEYGTSPHHINLVDLKSWSRRKLGDENLAGAVQQKIAEKGTDAQVFFRNSIAEVKTVWLPLYWAKVQAQQ